MQLNLKMITNHFCSCFCYSAAFDTVSQYYIYNILRLINFLERITTMIKNHYSNAFCMINNVKLLGFPVSLGVTQA